MYNVEIRKKIYAYNAFGFQENQRKLNKKKLMPLDIS